MKKLQQSTLLLALCLLSSGLFAQVQTTLDLAFRHIEDMQAEWGLDKADLSDLRISNQTYSKVGEVDHYYFMQRHEGVDVYNAVTSVHVNSQGKVIALRNNFIAGLAGKINTTTAAKNETEALKSVFQNLAIPVNNFNFTPKNRSQGVSTYDRGTVSNVDIQVKPIYQVVSDTEARLAWDITLDPVDNADYWNIRVDANDGSIIDKSNYTIYCQFENHKDHKAHTTSCLDHNHDAAPIVKAETVEETSAIATGGTYNVFAEKIQGLLYLHESPVHGGRNVISDPADTIASPFGWHDVDGVTGAEFTITRGNNVNAFLDVNDDDAPDAEGDVEGGEELVFDFPWTDLEDPQFSEPASVTNLFFMSNFMHDFAFAHGFDEDAGNFQQTNYTGEGEGDDPVSAQAQDGRELHFAALEADPTTAGAVSVNNANFATPPDGFSGRMQMFIWNRTGGDLLTILEPAGINGRYETATATYGPDPLDAPIASAEIVIAEDATLQNPTHGCEDIVTDVEGKIALIDRGTCFFQDKSQNAEDAGAIAVIVCNFENSTFNMGAGNGAPFPTIPSVMMTSSDCNIIKTAIANGETVNVSLGADGAVGADFYDGDVDNGIIAHEYGHGISTRLVGGPSIANCLFNNEQMGEGWSDYFTVVSTIKPGDVGTGRNGIGTYVSREQPTGSGIRSSPYSTTLSTNPETFVDLALVGIDAAGDVNAPHPVGTIWNSMLWDMYWALVDVHGFDNDLVNGEGGNNIAVRLVIEGLKMTACDPGFIDGRDGIFAADEMLFDGANACTLWNVFARRGLGVNAEQGDSNNTRDGVVDFTSPNRCVEEVKLSKRIASDDGLADVVDPGGSVPIELTFRNDKPEAATGLVLTESIPAGATVADISNGGEVVGSEIVWLIDSLQNDQELTYTYTLTVDPDRASETLFIDDLEDGTQNFVSLSDSSTDADLTQNLFDAVSSTEGLGTASGDVAFFVSDPAVETRENLLLIQEINVAGEFPGFRFNQNYDTESGADGTLIQISLDGGQTFNDVSDEIFKNGYPGPIQFGTFTLPFLSAYTGTSDGYIDTWVDLSAYKGQTIFIRFRFGSDDNTPGIGWAMDDFEYLDIVNYNTTATLTTLEGDMLELELPDRGIKVNSDGIVAVDDELNPSLEFNIFPNPASETVNIAINNITANDAQLSVFNYSGQLMEERKLNLNVGSQLQTINVGHYPVGFYFFQLTTDRGIGVEKVMVGK